MNEEIKSIGKRIRNKREQQNLSREKFSEMANISSQFLADIETGKKGMTVSTLKKICDALCVSTDEIIYGIHTEAVKIDDEIIELLNMLNSEKQDLLLKIIKNIVKISK